MTGKKFVVVLNRGYELSRLTSGLGHVTAGLVAKLSGRADDMSFLEYRSKDGESFPWISDHSFIILKGRGNHMRTLRSDLLAKDLPCVTYLDTMLEGGSEAELAATAERSIDELNVLAIATFGERSVLDGLTRKFSLWR